MEVTRENVMTVAMTDLRSMADDYQELGEVGTFHMLHGMLDEIERLRTEKEPSIICYWDTDDTEVGEPTIWEVVDRHGHGVVVGVDHVAVVRTTYHATLPPADDANSDDDWEVNASSADEAVAALEAEAARRKAISDLTADHPELTSR